MNPALNNSIPSEIVTRYLMISSSIYEKITFSIRKEFGRLVKKISTSVGSEAVYSILLRELNNGV
jgi:hypothetical protein